MNIQTLYDHDFNLWTQEHILLLKQARFSEIDTTHLIEELEDMAKSNKRELVNRLIILVAHLLKWQYQPAMRCNSWNSSINEQRIQLDYLLSDMPSLKSYLTEAIEKSYGRAVKLAVNETKLPLATFPATCSYEQKQLLDEDFYPDNKQK